MMSGIHACLRSSHPAIVSAVFRENLLASRIACKLDFLPTGNLASHIACKHDGTQLWSAA
jgi:hypothetical protein